MSTRWIALSLALALGTVGLVACGGEEEAAGSGATETPPVPETPPPPAEARPSWEESNFTLNASATGPYAPNAAGTFELRLDTRGGFHVNREYPWMVTVTTPTGVTTPSATIEGGGITLEEASARIPVSFTATAPGTHRITCAVDFGICTEENCQFETRNVAVDVVVAEAAPAPAEGAPAAPTEAAPAEAAPTAPAEG
jgi:hypothetical protein